ncbi:hypothetical protein ACN38_g885 [Penicillium nordicum]|uniref:Uncharacterized protein n=1 Tax=Penicillium nordicum TaxID=229535 RepID=A0A0M8P9P4_9EURO|nr:hypothetical protein ACN38_g885 [Penicillium nordicum]
MTNLQAPRVSTSGSVPSTMPINTRTCEFRLVCYKRKRTSFELFLSAEIYLHLGRILNQRSSPNVMPRFRLGSADQGLPGQLVHTVLNGALNALLSYHFYSCLLFIPIGSEKLFYVASNFGGFR